MIKPNIPKPKEWLRYLKKSYDLAQFSNGGPCSALLEKRLKDYLNLKYLPVLVSNATEGLAIALSSCKLPKESEVLIPSFTFAATAHSVLNANLKPVLVDCGDDTFLSLKDAENKINSRTKVIVVVQALGFACDYKKYEKFAKAKNLILIFDSAALLGAQYPDGKKVGVAGDFEIFSLHATKTFGIGEGGLITSKHNALLTHCRRQINFGFENGMAVHRGTNAKLSEFACAVGNAVLDRLDKKIITRRRIANWYKSSLRDLPIICLDGQSAYQVFPVIFKDKKSRNRVKKILDKSKIGNRIYYIPIHVQLFFQTLNIKDDFPKSDFYYQRILCLPIYEAMTKSQISTIRRAIQVGLRGE